jgi:hypothetical protein
MPSRIVTYAHRCKRPPRKKGKKPEGSSHRHGDRQGADHRRAEAFIRPMMRDALS